MLDKAVFENYNPILVEMLKEAGGKERVVAMKAAVDALVVHGVTEVKMT